MARIEFPRKVKAAIIARANGKCEKCGAKLKTGEGEIDHILPCALGGEATIANGRLICRVCHAEKTASDIRTIRKADRQRDKRNGAVRPKGVIKSQGFPVSDKAPRIDKSAIPPLSRPSLYRPVQEQRT
jgi:5-methylcytosine-specific restriction enzyme A